MGEIAIKLNYQTAREIIDMLQVERKYLELMGRSPKATSACGRYFRISKLHDELLAAVEAADGSKEPL